MFKTVQKSIALLTAVAFLFTAGTPAGVYAQMVTASNMPWMPLPGVRVSLSPEFEPSHLVGITIHPDNALQFDFLIDKGDRELNNDQKQDEYKKLIKYFLASLTVPDNEQWVNLSPYEKDRIIANNFGKTEMGRDLLAEDYILKQITSSLMYPEENLGKKFWNRIYQRAHQEYGTTEIPVNTFNKVWIVPDEALIYESGNTAYILKSHLKVMMQEDYLSLAKHSGISSVSLPDNKAHTLASQIVKEIILPELDTEVNRAKHFAPLRQIFSGMILATWYKKALRESLLGKVYVNKDKVKGVDQKDAKANEIIYQRYLRAFKKGVFNYIKEDTDIYTQQIIPRKYFSGGIWNNAAMVTTVINAGNIERLSPAMISEVNAAMNTGGFDEDKRLDTVKTNVQLSNPAMFVIVPSSFSPNMAFWTDGHIDRWIEQMPDIYFRGRNLLEERRQAGKNIIVLNSSNPYTEIPLDEINGVISLSNDHDPYLGFVYKWEGSLYLFDHKIPDDIEEGAIGRKDLGSFLIIHTSHGPVLGISKPDGSNLYIKKNDKAMAIPISNNLNLPRIVEPPANSNPTGAQDKGPQEQAKKGGTLSGQSFKERLEKEKQALAVTQVPENDRALQLLINQLEDQRRELYDLLKRPGMGATAVSSTWKAIRQVEEDLKRLNNEAMAARSRSLPELRAAIADLRSQLNPPPQDLGLAEQYQQILDETRASLMRVQIGQIMQNQGQILKGLLEQLPSDNNNAMLVRPAMTPELREMLILQAQIWDARFKSADTEKWSRQLDQLFEKKGNKRLFLRWIRKSGNLSELISQLNDINGYLSDTKLNPFSRDFFSNELKQTLLVAIYMIDAEMNNPPRKPGKVLKVAATAALSLSALMVPGKPMLSSQAGIPSVTPSQVKQDIRLVDGLDIEAVGGDQAFNNLINHPDQALSELPQLMDGDKYSNNIGAHLRVTEISVNLIKHNPRGLVALLHSSDQAKSQAARAALNNAGTLFDETVHDVLEDVSSLSQEDQKASAYLTSLVINRQDAQSRSESLDDLVGIPYSIFRDKEQNQWVEMVLSGLDANTKPAAIHLLKEHPDVSSGDDYLKALNQHSPTTQTTGKTSSDLGGIDLNGANLNLQIKRDGRGVPLPLAQQDMAQLGRIEGFVPVIIEIKPVTNLPLLSELQQKLQSLPAASSGT